jgi:hypothetical protein
MYQGRSQISGSSMDAQQSARHLIQKNCSPQKYLKNLPGSPTIES